MNYSIGIVTYHARFEKYFVPLVKKINEFFPNIEIICIANGHPEEEIQIKYLKKFTSFLKTINNSRYLTYEKNQSLAKCWNQIIIQSDIEGCLLLNDDTQITELFKIEFENKIIRKNLNFSIINETWSHFFITKKIIDEVGWFDENLLGIGQEDTDYMFRMSLKNMHITNTECLGIENYIAPAENPSWKEISTIVDGKYSTINKDYIKEKYYTEDFNPEIKKFNHFVEWKNSKIHFSIKKNIEIKKYPNLFLESINRNLQTDNGISNNLKFIYDKSYYKARKVLKKFKVFLKNAYKTVKK